MCARRARTRSNIRNVHTRVLARVPTSSSIIRRHGRVRFAVPVSTGDRVVLSHFLPTNRASSLPSLVRPSVRPRALSAARHFRLQRLPVGGLRPRGLAALASGKTTLSWKPGSWATPFDTPSTAWPTLPSVSLHVRPRQGRRPSFAGGSRRRAGGMKGKDEGMREK